MEDADIIRRQARERHDLEVPEERAREIAAARRAIAGALATHRDRLAFDDSPADHARLLRLAAEPGENA